MEFFIDSPYIAKLVGYCYEPACIVLKYYRAGSLDNWLEKNRARETRLRMNVLCDVARGVFILHERQVSHSDLKPQNVLVDDSGVRMWFVLTDFGISKILTQEYLASEDFRVGNLRGLTVTYAAPEALDRFRRKVVVTAGEQEKCVDVYSFGVFVYFMLMFESPWQLKR
jgi:serine/threonine protein kinase